MATEVAVRLLNPEPTEPLNQWAANRVSFATVSVFYYSLQFIIDAAFCDALLPTAKGKTDKFKASQTGCCETWPANKTEYHDFH